jgi:hypothetical protein
MGMRLVNSLILPNKSCLIVSNDFFLIATLAHDLQESALLLDDFCKITMLEGNGDGIDHAPRNGHD